MNEPPLARVQQDLQTIRNAIGIELPFGRLEVLANLWLTACGLAMAAWTLLAPGEYRAGVRILLAAIFLGLGWCAYRARKDRAARPWAWREHKLGLAAAVIMTPCVVAYIAWEQYLGMPREMVGAAALFSTGVAVLLVALFDFRRRYYLGGAMALIAFGICLPLLSPRDVVVTAGAVIAFSGLSAAAIQTWQLHSIARQDGSH